MDEPSELVGFICDCGRRTVFVRRVFVGMRARPGETIHDIRPRMKCLRCGAKAPYGPVPLRDSHESSGWACTDALVVKRVYPLEEP